jgi:3-methyladenine DNA glycosylase AlkC
LISKIQDIKELLTRGRTAPEFVFPEIKALAASDQWQTREVATTAMVEIGKRYPALVLRQAQGWAKDKDSKIRRAASESLRGIVKIDPEAVRPILEMLREDLDLYVKKSLANLLRNASSKHADFVLGLCREWMRSQNPHTQWIVRDGLRKLKTSRPQEIAAILEPASDKS